MFFGLFQSTASGGFDMVDGMESESQGEIYLSLEWPELLELTAQGARTAPGRKEVLGLGFSENWAQGLAEAKKRQQETTEVLGLLSKNGLWGVLQDLEDFSEACRSLEQGGVLEAAQLGVLRSWLYAVEAWGQFPLEEMNSSFFRASVFRASVQQLMDPADLIRVLERVLTPAGEISENASALLRQLFARRQSLRNGIDSASAELLERYGGQGVLQDRFIDLRDGRFVLPVKISAQKKVQGRVSGISVSRQTAFVEPRELQELNRELEGCENQIAEEVFRVLKETAERIRPFAGEIANSCRVLAYWDGVQARARFSLDYGGRPIEVTGERKFELRSSAHPLLWFSLKEGEVSRNDLSFGSPARMLLITGPNTGGKTVFLKTLGIAAVFARTGFFFPGQGTIQVPFFDRIFVDLGDPQSIARNISSFSGHLLKMKCFLEELTPRSLILIDEINSATDPQEGAALSRAFFEAVLEREENGNGAVLVATTHDPLLKTLGVEDDRILNAGMSFDDEKYKPTYRLVVGVPGRSCAIETARNLGLPPRLIQRAGELLGSDQQRVELLIEELEKKIQAAEKKLRAAEHMRAEAERTKQEWEEKMLGASSTVLERGQRKLRQIIEEVQDEARESLKRLEQTRSRKSLDRVMEGFKSRLSTDFETASGRLKKALEEESPELKALLQERLGSGEDTEQSREGKMRGIHEGIKVRVPKWKCLATILERKGDRFKVVMEPLFGSGGSGLQVWLGITDFEPLSDSELKKYTPNPASEKTAKVQIPGENIALADSIDVRGLRFEEAMREISAYLDQSFRAGRAQVTLIHGLGTGALREGAWKLARSLPYVRDLRQAEPHHGGAGATVVEFER